MPTMDGADVMSRCALRVSWPVAGAVTMSGFFVGLTGCLMLTLTNEEHYRNAVDVSASFVVVSL